MIGWFRTERLRIGPQAVDQIIEATRETHERFSDVLSLYLDQGVAHEVAHRIHMNHSREFHDLVARLYGADPAPARRWLRANGTGLHWFGRGND